MKTSKGFTLIELLAVIVILAILALIVTPVVVNIIEKAQEGADKRSIEQYANALKEGYLEKKLENSSLAIVDFLNDSELRDSIKYNGSKVVCDKYSATSNFEIKLFGCTVDGRGKYNYLNNKVEKVDSSDLNFDGYQSLPNAVYFDVSKGMICTEDEYKASYDHTIEDYSNSKTGYNGLQETKTSEYQNSCLKFYEFNNYGEGAVKLILDHNTTATIAWNSNYNDIPLEVLEQLKIDTAGWNGTEIPTTYYWRKPEITTLNTYFDSYEVNYSNLGLKARLISAEEVAEIIERYDWQENSMDSTGFEFDDECEYGTDTMCNYAWLYDRTSSFCKDYGCVNNSVNSDVIVGYWTSSLRIWFVPERHSHNVYSSASINSSEVWSVEYFGGLSSTRQLGAGGDPYRDIGIGIRPVIEISREKIS